MPEDTDPEKITGHGTQKKLSRSKNIARLKKMMDNIRKKIQVKNVLAL